MIPLLIAVTALSAPPNEPDTPGRIVFSPSPATEVVVLPRTHPELIEVVLYHNTEPIHDQLRGHHTRWVLDHDIQSIGGGTWFLKIGVTRSDLVTTHRWVEGQLVLELNPAPPEEELVQGPIDAIDDLIGGELERTPGQPARIALLPLSGDASSVGLDPSTYPLDHEPWRPRIPEAWQESLAWRPPTNDLIHSYRHALYEAPEAVRPVANYRLGMAHLELGLPREARYYFGQAAIDRPDLPQLQLARAQAALALEDWDEARDMCKLTAYAGGHPEAVLECLGVVSLVTSNPPPAEVARALRAATYAPRPLLLSAELLLHDHRTEEAIPLLASLLRNLGPELGRIARADLADALLAMGRLDEARAVWVVDRSAGDALYALAQLRRRHIKMLADGPTEWSNHLPELMRTASDSPHPEVAAEAHYLLAQIAAVYGDPDLAATHLVTLIDDYPEQALVSDIPKRLLTAYDQRLGQLERDGRWVEIVACHRAWWRPALLHFVEDTTALERVSMAFASMGLYEEALEVQIAVTALHARQDRDDLRSITWLADLNIRTNRPHEALDAITYSRRIKGSKAQSGALDVLEGTAMEALDRPDEAIAAYRRALRGAGVQPERAHARLGLLYASLGDCAQALPHLQRATSTEEDPEQAALALARCHLETNRLVNALAVAQRLAQTSADATVRHQATYLAAVAAAASDTPLDSDAAPPEGVWADLLEEDDAVRRLQEEVAARR